MNIPENKYLGKLCSKKHDWKDSGKSLRNIKNGDCCECAKEYRIIYAHIHKDKLREYKKIYYQNNKEIINERSKKQQKNNLGRKEYMKNYNQDHKEKLREYIKEYCQVNRIEIIKYNKKYYKEHKMERNEKRNIYRNQRFKIDPQFKLNNNIACLIRKSIKGNKNGHHWETLVGYTLRDLKKHIEKQFKFDMVWNNYGKWHVDHIIPISAFNFTKPEHVDFKRCWALSNLQPLCAKENMVKHAKLNNDFQPSLGF